MIDTFVYKTDFKTYPTIEEALSGNSYLTKALKDTFKNMGYDKDNPLKEFIHEGYTVLLKPNMVMDVNGNLSFGTDCLYTNPSIVAALLPFVIKALNNKGKIIIADAPMQSCNFDNLVKTSGYDKLLAYYQKKKIDITLMDLRELTSVSKHGILDQKISQKENIIIDLGKDSMHASLDNEKINNERITNYNPDELSSHHNANKHEYSIAKIALKADCIINLPKPKSHRKNGVTIGMKNFVGICTRKEYLPHHRIGNKDAGGDEYKKKSFFLKMSSKYLDKYNHFVSLKKLNKARFYKILYKIFDRLDRFFIKNEYREGSWYGNDTIWRTIMDLNKIINYCDKNGKLTNKKQREILYLADMIIIGEGEGPLIPSPKSAGMLVFSSNIYHFDFIICTLMGFDVNKVNLYKHIITNNNIELKDISIHSNDIKLDNHHLIDIKYKDTLKVKPTEGWKNHIEL